MRTKLIYISLMSAPTSTAAAAEEKKGDAAPETDHGLLQEAKAKIRRAFNPGRMGRSKERILEQWPQVTMRSIEGYLAMADKKTRLEVQSLLARRVKMDKFIAQTLKEERKAKKAVKVRKEESEGESEHKASNKENKRKREQESQQSKKLRKVLVQDEAQEEEHVSESGVSDDASGTDPFESE